MTIRKKTLGVIFSLFLFMGLVVYIIIRFVLINGYIELETEDMIKTTDQVSNQMKDDLLKLKTTVGDWAPWNDTYQFIQELNESYIQNNLMYTTIANLNINFMLFIGNDGRLKYVRGIDTENETAIQEKNDAYLPLLEENPVLQRSETQNEIVSGYARFNDKIVRLSSAPIMTSQFQGPVMGTLVIGNYINSREIDHIEEKLKLPLEIKKIDPGKPVEDFSINKILPQGHRFLIKRTDSLAITSSVLFESLSGKPLFIVEMKKRRDVYIQGVHTLNYLLLALGIVSLFFMAIMLIYLEKNVLYRLLRLSMDVKKITLSGHGNNRIMVSGRDEISSLSLDINQMLEKLWENEKRYQILFESASDAILLLKGDKIVDCNLKTLELFGCEKNQDIGKSPCFFSPEMQPDGRLSDRKFRDIIETSFSKDSLLFEWLYLNKDKTVFETEMNLTCISLPSGDHIQAIIRDITERKQSQRIIMQTEKMLSLGGLAAGMAHEINNPLSGMMQNAQLIENRLSRNLPVNVKAAEEAGTTLSSINAYMENRNILKLLRSINNSGIQAAKIVANMLRFARKDNSEKLSDNIVALLDNTIELSQSDYSLKSNYDFKKIKITREYESDLLFISCHSSSLQQVFFNIIKNAAEAIFNSPGKDKAPELIFRIMKNDAMARVEIEDNGPGIEEKVQKSIFEPFFTTKGPKEGTGLGLSVSYFIIVTDHGGKITVESAMGKGTKFIIELPLMTS